MTDDWIEVLQPCPDGFMDWYQLCGACGKTIVTRLPAGETYSLPAHGCVPDPGAAEAAVARAAMRRAINDYLGEP